MLSRPLRSRLQLPGLQKRSKNTQTKKRNLTFRNVERPNFITYWKHCPAIIGLELNRYNVDIAVLCESGLAEEGSLKDDSCGYTFYWSGLPETERRMHGECFAIRNDIAKNLPNLPKAVNETYYFANSH